MVKKPRVLPRYASDILAWEYDQRQTVPLPGELEWYLKYITLSGSPVLELACGSGRLLIPIAQAGFMIHGVDSSPAMLKRLQNKLKNLNIQIQQRVRVFHADILDFHPSQLYAIVMIAYNTLRELETEGEVHKCFQHVFNILHQEGYFLFTIKRIDVSSFKDGRKVILDSLDKPFLDEEKGLSVGSKLISFPDSENRITNEHTFVIKQRGGKSEIINFVTYTNLIDTPEYLKMLRGIGFTVQVSSGYNERPEDGVSKEICFVCRKSA